MFVFPAIIFVCWIFPFIRRIAEAAENHYIFWLMDLMMISLPFIGVLNPMGYLYFDDAFRKFWLGTFSKQANNNQEIEIQPQNEAPLINQNPNVLQTFVKD